MFVTCVPIDKIKPNATRVRYLMYLDDIPGHRSDYQLMNHILNGVWAGPSLFYYEFHVSYSRNDLVVNDIVSIFHGI